VSNRQLTNQPTNQQELKRIATKRRSQADVGTLTEEELCAAIDKSTGFIRFTLRKRRNNDEDSEDSAQGSSGLSAKQDTVLQSGAGRGQQQASQCANKKTKLLGEANLVQPIHPAAAQKKEAARKQVDTSLSAKAADSSRDEESASSSTIQQEDVNNNAPPPKHPDCWHLESVTSFKRWYSERLVALADYLPSFLKSGLDNLKFLNHPKLMNDDVLQAIDITNHSHRLLIVETVRSELPPVDFCNLLESSISNDQVSAQDLFQQLEINHLFRESNIHLNPACANTIVQFRHLNLDLPLGYRARLSAALDYLTERFETPRERAISKQSSADSSGSGGDVEMETSEASATSSSSSKDSIKSIVLMRQHQPTDHLTPPESGEFQGADNKENHAASQTNENSRPPPSETKVPQKCNVIRAADRGLLYCKTGSASSLVSEVARKLEAAAAQKNAGGPMFQRQPIAAARKINNKTSPAPLSGPQTEKESTLDAATPKSGAFVPVKSVCWPPLRGTSQSADKSAKMDATAGASNGAKRTAQPRAKEIDTGIVCGNEQMQSQEERVMSKLPKSKPAPPAKPAKLAVGSKFNQVDLSQRL